MVSGRGLVDDRSWRTGGLLAAAIGRMLCRVLRLAEVRYRRQNGASPCGLLGFSRAKLVINKGTTAVLAGHEHWRLPRNSIANLSMFDPTRQNRDWGVLKSARRHCRARYQLSRLGGQPTSHALHCGRCGGSLSTGISRKMRPASQVGCGDRPWRFVGACTA